MIEVRDATLADLPELVALGRAMHAESPRFNPYEFDALGCEQAAMGTINEPNGICLVAEEGDRLIGFFAGGVVRHYCCTLRYAFDYGLFVVRERRGSSASVRLRKAFEACAAALGADRIDPGVSTEVDAARTIEWFQKGGYRVIGALLSKDV